MTQSGSRMARAALLLSTTVILSRILGYGREVALYTIFGQNYTTDAYQAAFSIPDSLYMLLIGGALGSALIPVFSARIVAGREHEAWKAASIVFNYIILLLAVLLLIAYRYTSPLIHVLAPGLPQEYLALAAGLSRIMFIQTVFMVLNGFSMGILNSYHHFYTPAWGSLLYNVVIIVCGVGLAEKFGIAAFSLGVTLGAVASFLVQLPALKRVGLRYYPSFALGDPGFREIVALTAPMLAGLGVVQFNLLVTQNLASSLGPGVLSALKLAQRIMNLPIGIFAVSIGTVLFPTLAVLSARGKWKQFKHSTALGVKAIFLLTLPASLGLMAIGENALTLLFEHGNFTADMTRLTSQALLYYAIGIAAYSAVQVVDRSFYALKDTVSPVLAAVLSIGINIALSLWLVGNMRHLGLALAYSLAGIANLLLLLLGLRLKLGFLGGRSLAISLAKSLAAAGSMYLGVRLLQNYLLAGLPYNPTLNLTLSLGISTTAGVVLYGVITHLFNTEEGRLVLGMVQSRMRGKRGDGSGV